MTAQSKLSESLAPVIPAETAQQLRDLAHTILTMLPEVSQTLPEGSQALPEGSQALPVDATAMDTAVSPSCWIYSQNGESTKAWLKILNSVTLTTIYIGGCDFTSIY